MLIQQLLIAGAFLLDIEPVCDERGFFARLNCRRELTRRHLEGNFVQTSLSHSNVKGTLRGLHLQQEPAAEVKIVRCCRGSAFTVILDLRPESPTFLQHTSAILSADNRHSLYVPKGAALGFLTLEDHTEMLYQTSAYFTPGSQAGVRWNDPAFGIQWPDEVVVINERDRSYPDFRLPS